MTRVILITFGVLGWAWFELSGGTDFVPGENGVQVIARYVPEPKVYDSVKPTVVAMADNTDESEIVARDTSVDLAAVIKPATSDTRLRQVLGQDRTIPVEPEKLAALDTPMVMSDAVAIQEDAESAQPVAYYPSPLNPQASGTYPSLLDSQAVDYRKVTGSRVNLRGGPSTSFDVVTQLLQGEEVEVLDDSGNGWVKLRALDGSDIGWMSDSFLTATY
jgi:hypothetical protein